MNKYILGLSVLAVGLCSCSDEWDNHYKAVEQGDGNLWEAISAQPDLSNFAKLLKATEFDRSLSSSQVFTVFAPDNDALSLQECDSLIDAYNQQVAKGVKSDYNTVLNQYVKHHVALYNYSVSAGTNDSIRMMSYKYQVLGADNLSGVPYAQTNHLCSNGILFKLSEKLHYLPNIYERIKLEPGLDSVASFFLNYEHYEFSEGESVPGEVMDGKTQYLDSVMYQVNDVLSFLRCNVAVEDSFYYVLLPDNEVWRTELEKHQKHFVYDQTVVGRDSLSYLYPRLQVLDGAIYSRTNNQPNERNECMISKLSWMYYMSSVHSLYNRPEKDFYYFWYKEDLGVESVWDYFFNDGSEQIDCSNGAIYKKSGSWNRTLADRWAINSTINQECESSYTFDSVYSDVTRPLSRVTIPSDNPYYGMVSQHGYVEISPSASRMPKALFNVYNVLSNVDYDIYVVTVPPVAGDTLAKKVCNNFRITLLWNDEKGVQQKKLYPGSKSTDFFVCDSVNVKYDHVCTMSFPTSSFGLDKAQVKILVEGYTQPKYVNAGTHSTTTRIDRFIFIPRRDD